MSAEAAPSSGKERPEVDPPDAAPTGTGSAGAASEGAESADAGPLADQPPIVQRAIIGLVVVLSGLGVAATALSPYLLVNHPLLLVAMSPDARHVVLAASQVDLLPLLVVATPRRALALLGTYGLAGIYGFKFLRYAEGKMPRVSRMIAWLKRGLDRFGLVLIFLFPTHMLAGLCGATGTRLRPFLLAMVPGNVPFILMYYYSGEALAGLSTRLIAFLSANVWESTLVCTGLVVAQQVFSRWRKKRRAAAERDAGKGDATGSSAE